jgi:hypothetical protein
METIQVANSSALTNVTKHEDIFLLVRKLYRLPIKGEKIRAQTEELRTVQQKYSRHREKIVILPPEVTSSSLIIDSINTLK